MNFINIHVNWKYQKIYEIICFWLAKFQIWAWCHDYYYFGVAVAPIDWDHQLRYFSSHYYNKKRHFPKIHRLRIEGTQFFFYSTHPKEENAPSFGGVPIKKKKKIVFFFDLSKKFYGNPHIWQLYIFSTFEDVKNGTLVESS